MTTETLEASLQIILSSLPDEHEGPQRRKNSLTRADGEVMIKMIKVISANQGCSIGLTEQQMSAIKDTPASILRDMKDIVKERRRVLSALGLLTISVIGWLGKWIFETVDWTKIWHFMVGK